MLPVNIITALAGTPHLVLLKFISLKLKHYLDFVSILVKSFLKVLKGALPQRAKLEIIFK